MHEYRFRSEWCLRAAPDAVYRTLERLEDYPAWWPQVRRAEPLDSERCALTVRSLLPFQLCFVAHAARRDPVERVLEARLRGDIDGFSRWMCQAAATGTTLRFDQRVEVRKPVLRALAAARPAFRANHALMMWHGRRGLIARLDGA